MIVTPWYQKLYDLCEEAIRDLNIDKLEANYSSELVIGYFADHGYNYDRIDINRTVDGIAQKANHEKRWKENVLRGATLLDEIKPDWEEKIDLATLNFGYYERTLLAQVFEVDNYQKVLPLVFAGKGLQNVRGYRRQPGPPPPVGPVGETTVTEGLWKYEVTTGHYAACACHGFSTGRGGISNDELVLIWAELLIIRG